MSSKGGWRTKEELARRVKIARGELPAPVVVKGAQFLDVLSGKFVTGDVAWDGDTIVGTCEAYGGVEVVDGKGAYLVPGFIDAHVHIESSLLTPSRFEQAVLPEGTTTVIWDPHEIANVRGQDGIRWALAASEGLQLDVRVMIPSCVPSTSPHLGLETSGAELGPEHIVEFKDHPRVLGLAEMMNYPGLLHGDPEVHAKLDMFKDTIRDGHCPGLSGKDLNAYGVAGISTCHESTTRAEAEEKLTKGIHVWIREGSCAKDADELLPMVNAYTSSVLGLCSDDRNPLDIAEEGHINAIVNKGLKMGLPPESVFRAASFAPARVYGLSDRAVIGPGYKSDLVLVEQVDGKTWQSGIKVRCVWKNGARVTAEMLAAVPHVPVKLEGGRNLNVRKVTSNDFAVPGVNSSTRQIKVQVIGVRPRQILTDRLETSLVNVGGQVLADLAQDVLKIAVFERHRGSGRKTIGFVKGMNIKSGAIATSVNHDSHNCIVVGSSDQAMADALNALVDMDGGISVVGDNGERGRLALPIGGLMTDLPPADVAASLKTLKRLARGIGCTLDEPFLQLSFLALPVIPHLKITDRGLVDVDAFKIIPIVG